jgi:hypothetical protein
MDLTCCDATYICIVVTAGIGHSQGMVRCGSRCLSHLRVGLLTPRLIDNNLVAQMWIAMPSAVAPRHATKAIWNASHMSPASCESRGGAPCHIDDQQIHLVAFAFLAILAARQPRAAPTTNPEPDQLPPLSIAEIRRLLPHIFTPTDTSVQLALSWLAWRLLHQARARYYHYKRRTLSTSANHHEVRLPY